MTGFGGLAGFVLSRARAHRPLLAAALLTVLLTTAVPATLTAYSGAVGDAALRQALRDPRNAAGTALVVKADIPEGRRRAADTAVRNGARAVFDGLPVTVRTLVRSGPYALPRSVGPRAERSGEPDLTYFAALDPTQVRITEGRMPRDGAAEPEAALPRDAAGPLHVRPGTRLTLIDRLDGPPVRVLVTGLYRPARSTAPYWQLDDVGGRGVKKGGFTTYGPLLAAPGLLAGGRVSTGPSAWLASADFSAVTAGRTGALREAARAGVESLRRQQVLSGSTAATTSLPDVLDRLDRALLVARSTLFVAALQLALLAGCVLLLVARLLSAERAAETRLLRARGASRTWLAGLAGAEALLLAVPAMICAPLLAGPLTRLLAGRGALARIGLRPDVPAGGTGGVWLATALAALGCALAVTLPALTAEGLGPSRAGTPVSRAGARAKRNGARPGEGKGRLRGGGVRPGGGGVRPGGGTAGSALSRAGADIGLLVVAGVAYWQLGRQTSGAVTGGPAGADGSTAAAGSAQGAGSTGTLGVDPLLVAAPALALLAGTVLTLRLLPPVARLAERRAAAGRGLTAALAGRRLSHRPTHGTGPVLLLVLAVALGTLAVGQSASWDRSQDDQADFRAGAPVRVLAAGDSAPGRTETYAALPRVRQAAPVARSALPLSGDRTATVLALDTARAADTVLLRPDLASRPGHALPAGLGRPGPTAGAAVPAGTARLNLTATLRSSGRDMTADVTVVLEDRYGIPYRLPAGTLPADGRARSLPLRLTPSPGPLTLTEVQLVMAQPSDRAQRHRLTLDGLTATDTGGTVRRLPLPASWTAGHRFDGPAASPDARTGPTRPRVGTSGPPSVAYGTGYVPSDLTWVVSSLTVRLRVAQPAAPSAVTAVATDRFLASAGARTGQSVDVALGGQTLPVRITGSVRALPTTAAEGDPARDGGALLVDLGAVNRVLQARSGESVTPTEWWLATAPGDAAGVAAALRALPEVDPAQVVVRNELAAQLRDDPFGAGAQAAFAAAAGVAAALAGLGFAVSAAGSLRERSAEFAVLRALGASRRRLARTIAVEHGVLVALALVVGTALGVVLTRAVVPLIVLTPQAARPVPTVLVELPPGRVAVLLAAVAAVPLLVTAALALRRADPATALRNQGGE
ncbi:hypothetical protein GCM10010129_11940 [Streptomyces fumigatiscleroticus]|nr:hypothetical protein GCM10010129_11940 [Streptomyces fumigatiscleroticus]